MSKHGLIFSLIALLLLGVGYWIFEDAFPNRHFPVGWFAFCSISIGLGGIQAITGWILLIFQRNVSFATQLLRSGLFWLLIGGGVCAAPFLFSSITT